jgi:hypothetical protein
LGGGTGGVGLGGGGGGGGERSTTTGGGDDGGGGNPGGGGACVASVMLRYAAYAPPAYSLDASTASGEHGPFML